MRKVLISLAGLAALGTALGGGVAAMPAAGASQRSAAPRHAAAPKHQGRAATSCAPARVQHDLYQKGVLTVATDSPAYTPWFVGNKPSNGKGYESAVAYAVARQLGIPAAKVRWVVEPFDASFAPGPKKFDFDINEISYTPQRATAVSFSTSYYDVTQAIIALKNSPIVHHHSPAQLRNYIYGDQIGSTSLGFINTAIKPKSAAEVFNTLNDAKSALQTHRIDAFVADTPTAQYIASSEIPNSVVVGQFSRSNEHFGLLFAKGDPLVSCVDDAIAKLRANGTIAALEHRWLGIYNAIPTIKP